MEGQPPDKDGPQPPGRSQQGSASAQDSSNADDTPSTNASTAGEQGSASSGIMGPSPQFQGAVPPQPPMPPPYYSATAARPLATRVVPGQAIQHIMGQPTAFAPFPPPAPWIYPSQPPYAFLPMHAPPPHFAPLSVPMMQQHPHQGRSKTPPDGGGGTRQPTKKRRMADRGKRRKSFSPDTTLEQQGHMDPPKKLKKPRGRPSLSKKRPPTRTVTIKDDFPDRLVNPLLDLPEFTAAPNPPPEYIPNGAELYKWSELCNPRPDTFPISYQARLLGFDVPHCAPEDQPYVELNPETVPLVKDDVFFQVPPLGTFCRNVWNPQDQPLDYMDPVYRAITKHYEHTKLTPASTGAASTISQACIDFCREQQVIDKDWTFRFCSSDKDEEDLKRFCKSQKKLARMPGEFVMLAYHKDVLRGYIFYRFQWYRIDQEAENAATTPTAYGMPSATSVIKKPKVSELVFTIIHVNCPGEKEMGTIDADKKDANKEEDTEKKEAIEGDFQPARKEVSDSKPESALDNKVAKNVTEEATLGTAEELQSTEPVVPSTDMAEGSAKIASAAEQTVKAVAGDSVEKKQPTASSAGDSVFEHELADPAALVLTALALEHARSCNIWYGISQVHTNSIPWFEEFFRMSPLSTAAQPEGSIPSSTLVCDLQKCSYRYAVLRKRELDSGKTDATKATSKTASVQRERMLVRLPNVDEAKSYMQQGGQGSTFASRPAAKKSAKASSVFTSASQKMRSISVGVRVNLPTPGFPLRVESLQEEGNEAKVIATSAFTSDPSWEVLRVFPIASPKNEVGDIAVKDEDNEILNDLVKKQRELATLEGGFEPKLRSLLTSAIKERKEFEHPDAVKERETNKKIISDYEAVLERRREVDRAWQKQLEQDMDAVCDICADGEVAPDNQILFCEACNVAVHQMCYGVEKVPEGDYYCLACRYFDREKMTQAVARQLERGAEVSKMTVSALPICCELCPRKQGAFFRTDTSKETAGKEVESAKWVHVVCAKWQGLDFSNREEKVIESVTELKHNFRHQIPRPRCILCQGNRGAFQVCREEGCKKWLHVSCARSSGLCTVTHGENALGPVEENPWTLSCPEHSDIASEDVPEGRVSIEQLVRAAKEFPVEPDPPPPPVKPPKFHKMTKKERKKFLSDPEYEKEFLKVLMTEKMYGIRCEVCNILEQEGSALTRCKSCNVTFCDSCKLPTDGAVKGSYTCLACKYVEEKKESGEEFTEPNCLFCYQKGGWLREGIAAPILRKSHWNHHKKEKAKSLFGKQLWAHASCTMWQYPNVYASPETGQVDCSNIIMSNGRHLILSKVRCSLCCHTGGLKVKCDEEGCRDPREKRGPFNMHVTCARQAGWEVKDKAVGANDIAFYAKCFLHLDCEFGFRAKLEDLIEIEKGRAGKKMRGDSVAMTLAHASRLFNASIVVLQSLGWAWRWAEWWVHYGDRWEPFLEPGEVESRMTKEQLRIVDSTPESRCADARRCRLAALGAALRNRDYDAEKGDDRVALDRALRALLNTQSLVGPLEQFEIDFFADWLGRAYRSKSRLLGFGDDKIAVAKSGGCIHLEDKSPKYQLGNRPLPGKQDLPAGHVFESGITEPDDFLKPIPLDDGTELKPEDFAPKIQSKKQKPIGSTPKKPGRKPKKRKSAPPENKDVSNVEEDTELRVRKCASPGRARTSRVAEPPTPDETPERRGRPPGRPTPKKPSLTKNGKRRGRPPKKKPPPLEEKEEPEKQEESIVEEEPAEENMPGKEEKPAAVHPGSEAQDKNPAAAQTTPEPPKDEKPAAAQAIPEQQPKEDGNVPLSSLLGQRIPRKPKKGAAEETGPANNDADTANQLRKSRRRSGERVRYDELDKDSAIVEHLD